MIKLSKRLFKVASFIDHNSKVIDIGCDHAKLAIYLAQSKKGISIIASDINKIAYEQAKSKIKKYQVEDKIDLRLGSGLEVLANEQVDTIIMAGLGGIKIINLLFQSKNILESVNNIIIQANNKLPRVRKSIIKLGYFIFDEVLVKERSKIYTIIYFKRGKNKYRKLDFLFGPLLRKKRGSLYEQLINQNIVKYNLIIARLPKKYYFKRYYVNQQLKLYKKELIKKDSSFFINIRDYIKRKS